MSKLPAQYRGLYQNGCRSFLTDCNSTMLPSLIYCHFIVLLALIGTRLSSISINEVLYSIVTNVSSRARSYVSLAVYSPPDAWVIELRKNWALTSRRYAHSTIHCTICCFMPKWAKARFSFTGLKSPGSVETPAQAWVLEAFTASKSDCLPGRKYMHKRSWFFGATIDLTHIARDFENSDCI